MHVGRDGRKSKAAGQSHDKAKGKRARMAKWQNKIAPVDTSNMRSLIARYMGLLLSEPLKAASCCSVRHCGGTTCSSILQSVLLSPMIGVICALLSNAARGKEANVV